MSEALAEFVYRWRRLLVAGILGGALILAPRANIVHIDNDITAWFAKDDPAYVDYQHLQREFGGTRNLIIAIAAPSRDRLFSREAFDAIERMTRDIEHVEAVSHVNSLATATVVDTGSAPAGELPTLEVRPLFDDLKKRSPAEVGQRAVDDELLRGDLVSADGKVAAVIVFFDEDKVDAVRGRVLDEIRDVVTRSLPAEFKAYYNGSLEISETYNRVTLDNQKRFTPPILLLTLVAIFVMFRSWRKTFLTLGAVLVSVIWTLGLYDLMGFNYNVLSSMIVPLIIVLAIADDVHIMQHYDEERRHHGAEQSFKRTVRNMAAPLLGASGTTALGMLSLATSSVVAVRSFGIGSAVGVMVDFAISIVLVPTLLGWMRPETAPPPQETWFTKPMQWIARLSTRHARAVLAVSTLVTVIAALGLMRLRVDTNHINFFSKDHPLGQSAAIIDTELAGIYTFQVLLEGPPESLKQPDALKRLEALDQDLTALPFVRKVTSLADYVRRIHREIGGAGPDAGLPDDPKVIAQELFVFSMTDDGRVELDRMAASDFSKAQVTVKLAAMSSDLVFEQIHAAEKFAADRFAGTDIHITVTGSGRLFATLDHYLVVSQISSFATAFVTVFGVIFLIFRSWRFGALAIVPNLFPVLAVFGVMGWMGISLNIATIMLASVALGVVDDDTIHFISRYRRDTANGMSTDDAIAIATEHEGRASLTTALINSCSFGVLAFSSYKPTAWFGGMLGLTMLVAFLAEVFILPATIKLVPALFGADRVHRTRKAMTKAAR